MTTQQPAAQGGTVLQPGAMEETLEPQRPHRALPAVTPEEAIDRATHGHHRHLTPHQLRCWWISQTRAVLVAWGWDGGGGYIVGVTVVDLDGGTWRENYGLSDWFVSKSLDAAGSEARSHLARITREAA